MYTLLNTMVVFVLIRILICMGIGIFVYKDSQQNELDPWLWTLLVIMLPNFIGVFIYLIIRNKHKRNWHCSRCGGEVLEDYNLCPNCKAIFQKTCKHCNKEITQEIPICPYCGESLNEEISEPIAYKHKQWVKTNRTLGIILLTYMVSIVLGIIATIYLPYYKSQKLEKQFIKTIQLQRQEEENQESGLESRIYYEKFKTKTDKVSKNFNLIEGRNLGVKGTVVLHRGSIEINILNGSNKVIYNKIIKPGNEDIKITTRAFGTEKFKVIIIFDKAKGEINLETM